LVAFQVFSNLKDEGVKSGCHPSNCALLLWNIQALVEIKRMRENFLHLFESDATLWVGPQLFTFADVKSETA
jgi:hypothetical protein